MTYPPTPTPPVPPRPMWVRAIAITGLGLFGLFAGGMTGSSFVLVNQALGVVLMVVGMWLGLALGIWFGVRVTSRQRQPVDMARYPNQTFRHI